MAKRRRSPLLERYLYWPGELAAFQVSVWLLRLLPVDRASAVGGWLARTIGPRLRVTRRAHASLRIAFPEMTQARRREIVAAMWDNLGRVAAEYAHLDRITDPAAGRVEVVDRHHIQALGKGGTAGILASGHLGNWEILPVIAAQSGLEMTGVVREPNNPLVRPFLRRLRRVAGGQLVGKGRDGARQSIAVLRSGGALAMLADQKMNDGIPVALFGHDAMTAAAPAQLALRFDCPLVPVRVERLQGARFRVVCYPPLQPAITGDRAVDTADLMAQFHGHLEAWVRERPEQWLWLHRRWPKATYAALETA